MKRVIRIIAKIIPVIVIILVIMLFNESSHLKSYTRTIADFIVRWPVKMIAKFPPWEYVFQSGQRLFRAVRNYVWNA